MTQDERWLKRWQIAIDFINTNKRNPSKFEGAEREIRNWVKHNRKQLNAGTLKDERVAAFKQLLSLMEANKHKNQYE